MQCQAVQKYTHDEWSKSVDVRCFKEEGHETGHEGKIHIEGDYLGTMTW